MKKLYLFGGATVVVSAIAIFLLVFRAGERREQLRYEQEETELIISNVAGARLALSRAGKDLQDVLALSPVAERDLWLSRGNYFLQAELNGKTTFYPIPLIGYRSGPDEGGAFTVTIRPPSATSPPRPLPSLRAFVLVPSGHFLFGDHLRVQEPHYVWLPAFFISPFEVTNAEFREFLNDLSGYSDDANWTEAGRRWKAANSSHSSALLKASDAEFKRFGQPDQPVVHVNWFEANAFGRWLTRKIGEGRWIFGLPTEAEWEKVARGPDNFDYGLGMNISDNEIKLYNWKKNPSAEVTVVGQQETESTYQPNRYGVYHMTGNVAEWTQSIYRSYSRQHPYVDDDDRNHDEATGERVLRGGSWYTASVAVLYIPYRENFEPAVETPYLGFRLVARPVP